MQILTATAIILCTLLLPVHGTTTTNNAAIITTASTSSATHTIQVGSGGFVFSPDTVTAATGAILEFHFTGSIHTVAQSSFSSPCSNNDGIYSGGTKSGDVFQVTVNNTDPMWLYCSTPGHCQDGMVMVVNQGSSGDTLAAYKSAAEDTSTSNAPANAQGGIIVAADSSNKPSSSTSKIAISTSARASSSTATSGAGQNISSAFKNIALTAGIPVLAWLTK